MTGDKRAPSTEPRGECPETGSAAVAHFVRDRAAAEIGDIDAQDGQRGSAADRARLRAQAVARIEAAEQYLRLLPDPLNTARAYELLRTLCLMAGIDADHPNYRGAMQNCPLDCRFPLW